MNLETDSLDTLDLVGVPTGIFVALVGLATLAGTPWTYANSVVVTIGQILGAAGAVVLGVALAWYVYTAG